MLAEKTFNTETQLPENLQNQAVMLSGEMAWPADDALSVVEWLSDHGSSIAGVELWRNAGGVPRWIASNACSSDNPTECAREAAKFIREVNASQSHSDNLFNLTW